MVDLLCQRAVVSASCRTGHIKTISLNYFIIYSTPDVERTEWKRLPERWADVMAGRGAEFFKDDSLPSRMVATAYKEHNTATPPERVIGELASRTLLDAKDIRELFRALHKKATSRSRWAAVHQPTVRPAAAQQPTIAAAFANLTACGDCDDEHEGVTVDDNIQQYDASLVGKRVTVLWRPEGASGEPQLSDYYPATIVSYKGTNRKYKFIIHFDDVFDDGSSAEAIGLPDETIRVMTQSVSRCVCPTCNADGSGRSVPIQWEVAKP